MLKLFNFTTKKQRLNNTIFFNQELINPSTFATSFFNNNRSSKKTLALFSTNHIVAKFDQTVRKFANISLTSGSFNLSSTLNAPTSYLNFFNKNLNVNLLTLNSIKNTK